MLIAIETKAYKIKEKIFLLQILAINNTNKNGGECKSIPGGTTTGVFGVHRKNLPSKRHFLLRVNNLLLFLCMEMKTLTIRGRGQYMYPLERILSVLPSKGVSGGSAPSPKILRALWRPPLLRTFLFFQ